MKINQISPVLYGIRPFNFRTVQNKYINILSKKSQYVYRFLCIAKGEVSVWIGDQKEFCRAGDVIYLTPGEQYRLSPDAGDFSLLNIFFDYTEPKGEFADRKTTSCVFLHDFSPQLCSPKIIFEDAPEINQSTVFRHAGREDIFQPLLLWKQGDLRYDFYARSALCSLVARILQSSERAGQKSEKAENILEYINLHPEKDLSASALSQRFSYHPNHINHLIKGRTGMTLSEYVRHTKIQYAKSLITEGEIQLSQVAAMLGFYDYSHFYKAFLTETDITPTEFMKKEQSR